MTPRPLPGHRHALAASTKPDTSGWPGCARATPIVEHHGAATLSDHANCVGISVGRSELRGPVHRLAVHCALAPLGYVPTPLRSRRSSRRNNPASCTGKGASTISVAVARRTWPIETVTMSPMTASVVLVGQAEWARLAGPQHGCSFHPARWRAESACCGQTTNQSNDATQSRNLSVTVRILCQLCGFLRVHLLRKRATRTCSRDCGIRFRPQSTPSIAGRLPAHGRACSNSAAMRNSRASSPRRPTSWIAIGRPSLWKPQGRVMAGWPVRLKGCV